MKLLPTALIVVLVLAAVTALELNDLAVINQSVRERPDHQYAKGYSLAMVEGARSMPVGQHRIIGSDYLVQVTKVEKIIAAKNHEFLRYEIEFEHFFGCSGAGGSGTGVSVVLAYRNGYDAAPAGVSVIEGACSVNAAEKRPLGWRSKGVCQFYYDKAWNPRYLVLGAVDAKINVNRPAAKIDIAEL